MAGLIPYIYSVSKNDIWHSFFAIKLKSVSTYDPSYGKYKDFVFELLNRQIDFINSLDCPEDDRVINLRFICHPDSSIYQRGKITVAIIMKIPHKDKQGSTDKALTVFGDAWPILTSISDNYEFEPVVDSKDFFSLFDPFPISSITEIVRREDIIEIKTAKRLRGFENNQPLSSLDSEKLYYVYPFIWGQSLLSRTLKAMLFHQFPSMINVSIKPIFFTDEIETLFLKEIELVEKYLAIDESYSRIQAVSKNLHSQLLRLEDSPFYLKIQIASNGSMSKGLIDSFGVEITEHAGSPDIVKDVNDDYVFSGGYEWYSFENESEKEKAIDDLKWFNINFSVPSVAPQNYENVRYLFDSTQANCAFRLPVPQINEIPGIKTKYFKIVLPPPNMPEKGIILGYSKQDGVTQNITMLRKDRRRHMYITGQTGTGKSTLLLNMIQQDIENKEGLAVLDPHGELIDDILYRLPESRVKDVIYINFEDTDRPIPINMLEYKTELEKDMSIQLLFEIFERLYDLKTTGGPIFEMYMKNALYLIMDDPACDATVLDIHKVFADQEFRNFKISKARNPYIIEFWKRVAEKATGDTELRSMAPYIISKMTMFIYNKTLRNIVASQKSSINFRSVIDDGKILLVDLCKGKIGQLNSYFLGMIIVNKLLISTLGRSDIEDKNTLKDFYLYIDEFQNLATDSFVYLLSEARKYKLNAILANQYLTQIPDNVLSAIFGNVGSTVAFRLGIKDAEIMEQEFSPSFSKNDLSNLPNWFATNQMLANGEILRPFTMETFPAAETKNMTMMDQVKKISRNAYGRDIETIEKDFGKRYSGSDS